VIKLNSSPEVVRRKKTLQILHGISMTFPHLEDFFPGLFQAWKKTFKNSMTFPGFQ